MFDLIGINFIDYFALKQDGATCGGSGHNYCRIETMDVSMREVIILPLEPLINEIHFRQQLSNLTVLHLLNVHEFN